MFEETTKFIILLCTLIGSVVTVTLILKGAVIKDLAVHKKDFCTIHQSELVAIKRTNKIMLECHDVTLQALDHIANGKAINGEISDQRKKLKEHIIDSIYKEN